MVLLSRGLKTEYHKATLYPEHTENIQFTCRGLYFSWLGDPLIDGNEAEIYMT